MSSRTCPFFSTTLMRSTSIVSNRVLDCRAKPVETSKTIAAEGTRACKRRNRNSAFSVMLTAPVVVQPKRFTSAIGSGRPGLRPSPQTHEEKCNVCRQPRCSDDSDDLLITPRANEDCGQAY